MARGCRCPQCKSAYNTYQRQRRRKTRIPECEAGAGLDDVTIARRVLQACGTAIDVRLSEVLAHPQRKGPMVTKRAAILVLQEVLHWSQKKACKGTTLSETSTRTAPLNTQFQSQLRCCIEAGKVEALKIKGELTTARITKNRDIRQITMDLGLEAARQMQIDPETWSSCRSPRACAARCIVARELRARGLLMNEIAVLLGVLRTSLSRLMAFYAGVDISPVTVPEKRKSPPLREPDDPQAVLSEETARVLAENGISMSELRSKRKRTAGLFARFQLYQALLARGWTMTQIQRHAVVSHGSVRMNWRNVMRKMKKESYI